MIVCVQCSMKALLENKPTPSFDETAEEHIRKHHPRPTQNVSDLERKLADKFKESK